MFITSKLGSIVKTGLAAAFLASLVACEKEIETSAVPSATAQLERGELLSYACQACHTLGADGAHQIGPNLAGVFGRLAGSAPGFDYSPALRGAGFVWSPQELERWLADPAGFLPGTTMAFTGYQSPEDRAALIHFLLTATDASSD